MTRFEITLQDIYQARRRSRELVEDTPLRPCLWLSAQVGAEVYLKLDNLQAIGSFKIRGASNKLLGLSPAEKARGVVTFSTGNHGIAVADVARQLGISAVVCLSRRVPAARIRRLEQLGAEVRVHGQSQDEAMALAFQLEQDQGLSLINPIDDLQIIAGHGTLGLELIERCPALERVLVPVSGGALVSGIALALKSINPAIRVIGVSMERAPVMYRSLQAGHPVELAEEETLAVSLAGGIGLANKYTFAMVRAYVDELVLVSEADIARAMRFALEKHHLLVEGAGAVGIAALLSGTVKAGGGPVAVVVTGGNVELPLLAKIAGGDGPP